MFWRLVAMATCAAAVAVAGPAYAGSTLTLEDAFARVEQQHPDLRVYAPRRAAAEAELAGAARKPALAVELEVENAFGSGAARGLHEAEFTLSLASVFERGGKRSAREALARGGLDMLSVAQEKQRLDLLAETARRYLAVVAARAALAQADTTIKQLQDVAALSARRHRAGAVPESVPLMADAALAQAELARDRLRQQQASARRHLAALWGEHEPRFELAAGDVYALPRLLEFALLADWLQRTPELALFADRQRVAEARLRLAQSQAVADVDWQIGVRRLATGKDYGLVGSVSIPFGSRSRAGPDIRAAQARIEALAIEKEAAGMALYATLADAHGRYQSARLAVRRLGADVLPRLRRARDAAAKAWRAGAASHLAWSELQAQCVQAARERLGAAVAAHQALIEIQRLTGQPLLADPNDSSHEGTS